MLTMGTFSEEFRLERMRRQAHGQRLLRSRRAVQEAEASPAPDPVEGAPVIDTRGLRKHYGDVVALDGVDLRVPPRSIVGFLGPNGAGKTTAMKLLLGLARPTGGSGTVFGLDLVRESHAIRRRVGYLAQEPHFDGHRSARQILHFAGRFFGPDDADLAERVARGLELVGLQDKADRPVRGFSGGERQRLGIAQAQIHRPDLLILDEPAASLDPLGRRDVLRVMERLRERTTILYSTHILADVERVSDHVAILDRGRLVRQGPTRGLLDAAAPTFAVTLHPSHDPDRVEAARLALEVRPWVRRIASTQASGATTWHVDVEDEDGATVELLPATLAAGLTVTAYGRRTSTLEDVFVDLIEAPTHEGDPDDA